MEYTTVTCFSIVSPSSLNAVTVITFIPSPSSISVVKFPLLSLVTIVSPRSDDIAIVDPEFAEPVTVIVLVVTIESSSGDVTVKDGVVGVAGVVVGEEVDSV